MIDSEVFIATELMSPSPSASPQSSPRPSPRQHHKRDHSKSDIPVGSYKDSLQIKSSDIPDDSLSRSSDSGQIPDLNRSISQEAPNKERTKEPRSSDRTKKKSSWYNVLYPTYKSRSEDFKRIFKDVPPEERLVVGKRVVKVKSRFYLKL